MAKRRCAAKRKEATRLEDCLTDLGTAETRAHGQAVTFYSGAPGETPVKRARVQVQVGLDYLKVLGKISHGEWEAGERFRRDYHIAGLEQRVTVDLNGAGGGGRQDFSEFSLAARARVRAALNAVTSSQCQVVIWHLEEGRSLQAIGVGLGALSIRHAQRIGMTAIRDSLLALAEHYGIDCDE